MSRTNDLTYFHTRLDMTDQTVDTHIANFSCPRPFEVTEVVWVPGLPMDTDTDSVAFDVSYSTDGFSSSDVEICAMASTEFNDTTNTFTLYTQQTVAALTTANVDAVGVIRVPADAVIRCTITTTGASADGFIDLFVWGHIL